MTARQTHNPASADAEQYHPTVASWRERAPFYRRISANLGLQGKLVICFMALLSLGLGASCWKFISQSTEQLADVMGEQARQLSSALAMSSEEALRSNDMTELRRLSQELIKSRNILFVGFLDVDSRPLLLASRDLDFGAADLTSAKDSTQSLMQVRERTSPLFGKYLEVVAPILSAPRPILSSARVSGSNAVGVAGLAAPFAGPRLLGYVAVGVSQAREAAQLRRINCIVIGIGGFIVILSLPLVYAVVHRVFLPIRQLVDATETIIAGDLDTRVAIHRPDMIGTLARSFNEMVMWVKKQQQDLAAANELLAEANRLLEQKVEQRTAQLEVANVRLSSEIAEKEDFLRAVSHDLNAPLRNISGMASMLLMKYRDRLDEDVVHRLQRIQKNVEAETELISELLELSRIKTRRQKMEHVEVDALVRELREMFENDLHARRIELSIDNPLPVLECERARMRQVFQNLIDNAIKYMGDDAPGKPRQIHVGCTIGPTEAEFYVRDTGIGIDQAELDKVFFVFRRGKSPQVQSVVGKGVGLASVKSIIETYNGKIWVESAPGEGSTFRFTINGKYVPAAAQRAARLAAMMAATTAATNDGTTSSATTTTTTTTTTIGGDDDDDHDTVEEDAR